MMGQASSATKAISPEGHRLTMLEEHHIPALVRPLDAVERPQIHELCPCFGVFVEHDHPVDVAVGADDPLT